MERGAKPHPAIASALRQARQACGLTLRDVGAALGVGPQHIHDIETARRHLLPEYIPRLPPEIRREVLRARIAAVSEEIVVMKRELAQLAPAPPRRGRARKEDE
jgi:transcriptional regulator with XRE-family HTH domain